VEQGSRSWSSREIVFSIETLCVCTYLHATENTLGVCCGRLLVAGTGKSWYWKQNISAEGRKGRQVLCRIDFQGEKPTTAVSLITRPGRSTDAVTQLFDLGLLSMHLDCLPPEALLEVIRPLDNASKAALTLTNHRFHQFIMNTKHMMLTYPLNMTDLLWIERWPVYDRVGHSSIEGELKQPISGTDYFACCRCRKIRDAIPFTNAMMRGKRGKHGFRLDAEKRACIDCLIHLGSFTQVGVVIQFGGAILGGGGIGIFCGGCHAFKQVGAAYRSKDHCDDCRTRTSSQLSHGPDLPNGSLETITKSSLAFFRGDTRSIFDRGKHIRHKFTSVVQQPKRSIT